MPRSIFILFCPYCNPGFISSILQIKKLSPREGKCWNHEAGTWQSCILVQDSWLKASKTPVLKGKRVKGPGCVHTQPSKGMWGFVVWVLVPFLSTPLRMPAEGVRLCAGGGRGCRVACHSSDISQRRPKHCICEEAHEPLLVSCCLLRAQLLRASDLEWDATWRWELGFGSMWHDSLSGLLGSVRVLQIHKTPLLWQWR